ncbi:MAG TPA: hypothetical protein VHV74_00500 [Pseudonocardiaceae bacterium]|nr:hypothetical protein [Pseudonocardiaceae bacterium]
MPAPVRGITPAFDEFGDFEIVEDADQDARVDGEHLAQRLLAELAVLGEPNQGHALAWGVADRGERGAQADVGDAAVSGEQEAHPVVLHHTGTISLRVTNGRVSSLQCPSRLDRHAPQWIQFGADYPAGMTVRHAKPTS